MKTTKWVAAKKIDGVWYYDNGCRAADGGIYITTDGKSARSYAPPGTPNQTLPVGYRLKRITYHTRVCGGGYFIEAGPTGA